MVTESLVSADALWLMQGCPFPVGWGIPPSLTAQFPFPELVAEAAAQPDSVQLSLAEQRTLTGNAMHWAQVGAIFLHAIAFTEKRWHLCHGDE